MISKLAILGPGLLGGSIALATRARLQGVHIGVWARRQSAVDAVLATGAANVASTELKAIIQDCDLAILCVPVDSMPELARSMAPWLRDGAVVTDVGSVKKGVVAELSAALGERGCFIGSHPMAGSEQAGLEAARADLFEGAVCIVTPEDNSHPNEIAVVERFWMSIGCVTRLLSPAAHDDTVALVSHLPHFVAAVLVDLICSENRNSLNFCGKGFIDTTRVASGSAEMWTGIFGSNRRNLKKTVDAMIAKLREASALLEPGREPALLEFLRNAKRERDALAGK